MDTSYGITEAQTWDLRVFDLLNLDNSLDAEYSNVSSASASGRTTPYESFQGLTDLDLVQVAQDLAPSSTPDVSATKKGGRLDRQAVLIMRRWLDVNKHNPYPSNEDISMIQCQTGLSTTQIAHWFSNARRRRKIQRARSSSHSIEGTTSNTNYVPPRPGTPAPRRNARAMTPIERWYDSPADNEPAAASAIALAMNDGSALNFST